MPEKGELVSDETREVVERFWAAMNTNDWRAVGDLLHDEYVLEWPQSGERLRGRDSFAAMNGDYPANGVWQFTVNRLVADGDTAVTDVSVTDSVVQARAITFSVVRDGRIIYQNEYWPDPFEPQAWRAHLVERML